MIVMQEQPDNASCLITAIAMVIDVPVVTLIEEVGKPYKDIIHFGRPGSLKYRGHHPQDFTKVLLDRGWALVINYARWPAMHFFDRKCLMCGGTGKFKGRWEDGNLLINGNKGILQYGHHFCAWDGEQVYNPNGQIYDFHTTNLIGFHLLLPVRNEQNVSDRPTSEGQTL